MLCTLSHSTLSKHGDMYGQDPCALFDFLFPDAAQPEYSKDTAKAVQALHEAMHDADKSEGNHSTLPPVMTYLGQFIDHDITHQEAQDPDLLDINGKEFEPQPREKVVATLANQRTGRFDLDSLYGKQDHQDPVLAKMTGFLRYPKDRAKMWIAFYSSTVISGKTLKGVEFPKDRAGDLLRLDRLMTTLGSEKEPRITLKELKSLKGKAKSLFLKEDGSPNLHRAIIGDSRNDENLFVAQLHLAFLRLHNRMVDTYPHGRKAGDEDTVHAWARGQVRMIYQWIVVNIYLKEICDPVVLQWVIENGSPLYAKFRDRCASDDPYHFPIPIEFSVAAFRMGHSMVRANYDWNEFFGRGAPDGFPKRASFEQMFLFTGSSPTPMPRPDGSLSPHLPSIWGADWSRLVGPIARFADRSTRRIDTDISLPLTKMDNEVPNTPVTRNLLARNLRRGYRMNVPSAQECIKGIEAALDIEIDALTKSELLAGKTGKAVKVGDFHKDTPLWFYVLKEAEERHGGNRLGPLGTHLVAGTIAGLLFADEKSVLNEAGSVEGRWHPKDGHNPDGIVIDSLPSLMTAAGLL